MRDAGDAGHIRHPRPVAAIASARISRSGAGTDRADLGVTHGLLHARIVRPRELLVLSAKTGFDPCSEPVWSARTPWYGACAMS